MMVRQKEFIVSEHFDTQSCVCVAAVSNSDRRRPASTYCCSEVAGVIKETGRTGTHHRNVVSMHQGRLPTAVPLS